MAVEVKVDIVKLERKYPYVGKHKSGLMVFFVEPCEGTVLASIDSPKPYEMIARYYDEWNEDNFTPLSPSESITLRNV